MERRAFHMVPRCARKSPFFSYLLLYVSYNNVPLALYSSVLTGTEKKANNSHQIFTENITSNDVIIYLRQLFLLGYFTLFFLISN